MSLSPTMRACLDKVREHGILIRWPGGYWSAASAPLQQGTRAGKETIPEWHFGTQTIHALIDRGLVTVSARMRRGDPQAVACAKGESEI